MHRWSSHQRENSPPRSTFLLLSITPQAGVFLFFRFFFSSLLFFVEKKAVGKISQGNRDALEVITVGNLRDLSGLCLLLLSEVVCRCCALRITPCDWPATLMSSLFCRRVICSGEEGWGWGWRRGGTRKEKDKSSTSDSRDISHPRLWSSSVHRRTHTHTHTR